MAQKQNGPIIGLSIFIVLSVTFAVFWYMSAADNQQLRAQLETATNEKQSADGTIQEQIQELNLMKDRMGYPNTDVGVGDPTDEGAINKISNDLIARLAGDSTGVPPNFAGALMKEATENDNNRFNANQRQRDLQQAQQNLTTQLAAKDVKIQELDDARSDLEQRLLAKEAAHSEEMKNLEDTNQQLRQQKQQIEQDAADFKVAANARIAELDEEINGEAGYRKQVEVLRRQKRDLEDPTFFTPDGYISTVDHLAELCYVNLGSADGLRVGVSFSVYAPNHRGVGKTNTDDIKGKIEIVRILGPHRAEAAILSERDGRPIADDDPIFSPIFQSGQSLKIAIAGRITAEGLDRAEFHRLVLASGGKVVVEVNDDGEYEDGNGNVIDEATARKRIADTRFIIIADLGDLETKDTKLEALARKIHGAADNLIEEAAKRGIYDVNLPTYLEHIGFKRRQIGWTRENSEGYPGQLVNGAKSLSVNASYGSRAAHNVISGKFSNRKSRQSVSPGTTSKYYQP